MAKYTVELGDIVKSGLKIFNFDYVLYDETKKPEFEEMFIDHFFFREIGTETVGRFQHYLKCKCRERLPYYNVLFKTALYDYDVKNNYNLTETFTKTTTNAKTANDTINQNGTTSNTETVDSEKVNTLESTTNHNEDNSTTRTDNTDESSTVNRNTTTNANNKHVESKTPAGMLSMTDITNNVYASSATIDTDTGTTVDAQTTIGNRKNNGADAIKVDASDLVDARSEDTISEDKQSNTTSTAATNAERSENDTGTESYTLERVGDIGVDTTPDKLKKHIEIQRILTTVYSQFLDECEDLFMQLY